MLLLIGLLAALLVGYRWGTVSAYRTSRRLIDAAFETWTEEGWVFLSPQAVSHLAERGIQFTVSKSRGPGEMPEVIFQ